MVNTTVLILNVAMAEWNALKQAKSMAQTFKESMANCKWLAEPETIAARMEICEACPKLKKGKLNWRGCIVCGCGYKRKVSAQYTSCPLEKW